LREAVGQVLNIAASENAPVLRKHRGTDLESGIGRMGVLPHSPSRIDQLIPIHWKTLSIGIPKRNLKNLARHGIFA
jgi:hypothetical protein